MSKKLEMTIYDCSWCPYHYFEESHFDLDMFESDNFRCKKTGRIIISRNMLGQQGWPPVPDWCPLPDIINNDDDDDDDKIELKKDEDLFVGLDDNDDDDDDTLFCSNLIGGEIIKNGRF